MRESCSTLRMRMRACRATCMGTCIHARMHVCMQARARRTQRELLDAHRHVFQQRRRQAQVGERLAWDGLASSELGDGGDELLAFGQPAHAELLQTVEARWAPFLDERLEARERLTSEVQMAEVERAGETDQR